METAFLRRARWVVRWLTGICLLGPPVAAVAGDWTITPHITGQEIFTDNVLFTPTNRHSDFITSISPGISIAGESTRLRATFDYSPTLAIFALTPSQDFIGHNLYANATATIVPDLFFLDGRGYMALLPTNPGLTAGLSSAPSALPSIGSALAPGFATLQQGIPRNQLTQASSFSASPYLAHRFDGLGSAELRYTFSDTNFGGTQTGGVSPPGFAVQNTSALTNEATASFLTGENLGRFQARFLLDAAESSGTGVLNGSQVVGLVDTGYAITRTITALATIGHEQLHFGGFPPTRIDDLVWGFGARLTPSPDATLVLNYGHRNGITAPSASLIYNLTARTTLSANYSEGLSTVAQDIANNLAVSDVNQLGQPIDSRTGVPLLISNPVLGLQSGGLFRDKQLTAMVTTSLDRDQITAFVYRYENAIIAQSTPGSGVSQRVTGATITWSRELNPRTTANLGIGYARINLAAPTNTSEDLVNATVSVSYLLTSSLSGWASYSFLDRSSPQPQFRLAANIISIGVRKDF